MHIRHTHTHIYDKDEFYMYIIYYIKSVLNETHT